MLLQPQLLVFVVVVVFGAIAHSPHLDQHFLPSLSGRISFFFLILILSFFKISTEPVH